MSSPVIEHDTFPATIQAPDVADTTYPEVVLESFDLLADRTRYHENTLTGAAGTETILPGVGSPFLGNLVVPSAGRADLIRNIAGTLRNEILWLRQRVFGANAAGAERIAWYPILGAHLAANWSDETYTSSGILAPFTTQTTVSANYATFSVPPMPVGMYLTSLQVVCQSVQTHGALPATMPRIALVKVSSVGVATEIGGALDTSASTAAYEAVHTISATLSHAIVANEALQLHIRGEDSTNAEDDSFRIFSASLRVWFEP
jgi:hypothetical protein